MSHDPIQYTILLVFAVGAIRWCWTLGRLYFQNY